MRADDALSKFCRTYGLWILQGLIIYALIWLQYFKVVTGNNSRYTFAQSENSLKVYETVCVCIILLSDFYKSLSFIDATTVHHYLT